MNDEKIEQGTCCSLKDGDQIRVGRSILKFMSGANLEANYHEEIYRLMTVDALTQVYNKRYFTEALEREYNRAQRYKRELSLVLIDVDHFKAVNDEHGHLAGDAVLRQVAAEVKPRLREQDILARVGGEEFAALLPEINCEGATATAEKVRRIVEAATFVVESLAVKITISAGVTSLDPRVRDPMSLFERADAALYEAKRSGEQRQVRVRLPCRSTGARAVLRCPGSRAGSTGARAVCRPPGRRAAHWLLGQALHASVLAPCAIHARTRSSSSNVSGSVAKSSAGVCSFEAKLIG